MFHLFTHAFFKALLFLGSGSVIHAMSGEQDMRRMGGLAKRIPWTFGTFLIGTLAIAGIPFFAGFYSKDEILLATFAGGQKLLFGIALFTALLTAFYMARLLFLTFFGEFRGGHEAEHHLHESPWTMLGPLVVLAAGSLVAGYKLFPGEGGTRVQLPEVLQPVFRLQGGGASAPRLAAGHRDAVGRARDRDRLVPLPGDARGARLARARSARRRSRVFAEKYYFDDVYDGFVRNVVVAGSEKLLWMRIDAA